MENQKKLTGAFALFGKSLTLIRKNLKLYALIFALEAFAVFTDLLAGDHPNSNTLQTLSIFLDVTNVLACVGAAVLNLRVAQGKTPDLSSIFDELGNNWLWLKLTGFYLMAGVLIVLSLLVFFAPALTALAVFSTSSLPLPYYLFIPPIFLAFICILFGWRWFLVPYLLVDKKTKLRESLSESWKMTKGYAWSIWSIFLVMFLIGLAALINHFFAVFLITCYLVAPAIRYEEIKLAKLQPALNP